MVSQVQPQRRQGEAQESKFIIPTGPRNGRHGTPCGATGENTSAGQEAEGAGVRGEPGPQRLLELLWERQVREGYTVYNWLV